EPVAASLDDEVVPLEHAHQHAPQWSFDGVCDATTFRRTAVVHRIMLAKRCEDLDDGSAICFEANIVRGPLHPNLGTSAIAMERRDKQCGNRQRNGLGASHRGHPQRKTGSEAEQTQRRGLLARSVRAAVKAWASSIHYGGGAGCARRPRESQYSRTCDGEGPTPSPRPRRIPCPFAEHCHSAPRRHGSAGAGV